MKTTQPLHQTGLVTLVFWLAPCASAFLGAQTIQLPTYRVFQMPLNVIVPDGGTTVVGGTNFSAASQSTQGLPLFGPVSRQRRHVSGSSSVSVSATIIDHGEWDAAVLAEAARRRPDRPESPDQVAAERMTEQIRRRRPTGRSVVSLATQARQRTRAKKSREEAEAFELIRHGDECFAKGQFGAARIFFRTALRQSSGAAHHLAEQRLTDLSRR